MSGSTQSPYILDKPVVTPIKNNRAILARKRVTKTDIYHKFFRGDVYNIYSWECEDGVWYVVGQNLTTREWQYIREDLFNWDGLDFEVRATTIEESKKNGLPAANCA